ncbi:hypothetical protein AB0I94_32020 [Streptomyces sp. NPDC050147]|uniref:hypothetical protein n=1 Tax=Streptomyces sp. NPDC050147 TaxID=3155513 RepID=UPI003434DCF9
MTADGLTDIADHLVLTCEADCAEPDRRIHGITLRMLAVGRASLLERPADASAQLSG